MDSFGRFFDAFCSVVVRAYSYERSVWTGLDGFDRFFDAFWSVVVRA